MSVTIHRHQDLGPASDWPQGTINSTAGPEVYDLLMGAEAAMAGISSSGAVFQDSGGERTELQSVIDDCRTRLTALGWQHPDGQAGAG